MPPASPGSRRPRGSPGLGEPRIPPRGPERFPKLDRLLRRSEFLAVQRRGARWQASHVTLMVLDSRTGRARLGIIATKKVGNAVARNRFKRRVREVYRRHRAELPAGKDLVVIAKAGAPELPFAALAEELLALGRRAVAASPTPRSLPPGEQP